MKKSGIIVILSIILCLAVFAGCSPSQQTPTGDKDPTGPSQSAVTGNNTVVFSDTAATVSGQSVKAEGTRVTISAEGTYTVSGSCSDGSITVSAPDTATVYLILDGLTLCNKNGAVINGVSAKKIFICPKKGTSSVLSDTFTAATRSDDAVIYSKTDITLNGEGKLTVEANYKDGIATSDDLKIKSGETVVTAVNNGMKGKDRLEISGGTVNVAAGNDGLKSTKETNPDHGYVLIEGGNVTVKAVDDGVYAFNYFRMTGGTLAIESDNNGIKSETLIDITGGTVNITTSDDGLKAPSQTGSATADVTVNGQKIYFK